MFKRNFLVFVLVLTLCFSPTTAISAASGMAYSDAEAADYAGEYIADAMKLILDKYSGGEVDLDMLFDGAMHGMFDALDDYSAYFSEDELDSLMSGLEPEAFGIGIWYERLVDGNLFIRSVYDNSPGQKAGIKAGDIVIKVDGKELKRESYSAILNMLDSNAKEDVDITVARDGETLDLTVVFGSFVVPTVFVKNINEVINISPDDTKGIADYAKIRVVEITSIGNGTAKEFKNAMQKMKADGVKKIIIDLRGNSGGYLNEIVSLCNLIVPKGLIMTTVNKQGEKKFYKSYLTEVPYEKIYVLTDGNTASAAEVFASALKDSKAGVIVGETTYGKGVIQTLFNMGEGSAAKITTEEYFSRNGNKINNVGVTPNIKVDSLYYNIYPVFAEKGAVNDDLLYAKKSLAALGFEVSEIDNVYDESTVNAIKKYQADRKLDVTGYIDTATAAKLYMDTYMYSIENDAVLNKALSEIMK